MNNEMRLKLDRRIHNQRVALRENWMITEMRRTGFVGSGAAERWRNHALNLYKDNLAHEPYRNTYGNRIPASYLRKLYDPNHWINQHEPKVSDDVARFLEEL